MYPTRIDLSEAVRTKVNEILNARLADVLDLKSHAKQAHWNVKGPHFIGLHKLFDEVAETVDEFSDEIAERIVILGGTAYGTSQDVVKSSSLPAYPENIGSGQAHIVALATSLAACAKLVRADIATTDEAGDADTADLLTGLSRSLDKYLWFVEAHVQTEQ